MKNSFRMAAIAVAAVIFVSHARNADAAEIKVLSAFGMQSVMEDLGPKFERATGHKLAISFATAGAAVSVLKVAKPPMSSLPSGRGSMA